MLAYIFVVLAVAVRFMPHPWHFTPVAASLLFFGAYRSRRELWFPVVLLAASDVLLNRFVYHYPVTWDLLVTWAWYAAAVSFSAGLPGRIKPFWVIGFAPTTSGFFFLPIHF